MPTLSKRTTKNKPATHESNKQRLKRLLHQMVRNEFSIPSNEVTNGYAATLRAAGSSNKRASARAGIKLQTSS